MKITEKPTTAEIDGIPVRMRRTTAGVIELWADDDNGLAAGLGFVHAHDRMVQLSMTRLAAQGRLAEFVPGGDELLQADILARRMGFEYYARREIAECSDRARALGEAYCAGINAYLDREWTAIELRALGYEPEPWTLGDVLAVMKMTLFIQTHSQQDMERFIFQSLAAGVDFTILRQMFTPHLDSLDEDVRRLLPRVRVAELVPFAAAPKLSASNNWAVAGSRTASGKPIACWDPHVECNRLPNTWYEMVAHTKDDYRIGVSVPGCPGFLMGRNRHVAASFTYGSMDTVDTFVERCDDTLEVERRDEIIHQRGADVTVITVYSSKNGVLETDVHDPVIPEGYVAALAWAAQRTGAAQTLDAIAGLQSASSADEAADVVRGVALSTNWILADDESIIYQQAGLLPRRTHSGLHPVAGWDERMAWDGWVPAEDLVRIKDPADGVLATANDHADRPGVNLSMGPTRVDRVFELLGEKEDKITADDMAWIQRDLYSRQAAAWLPVIVPLLPDTRAAQVLATWDCRYTTDSLGAALFEEVYTCLMYNLYGAVFGETAWDSVWHDTGLVANYFFYFDRWALSGDPSQALKRAIDTVFLGRRRADLVAWGERQRFTMSNLFLGGRKLPGKVSGDRGPFALPGGRATVCMGSLFREHGRKTTFSPSYRCIADLAKRSVQTALAGGPSGRPLSKWYDADVERWRAAEYKTLAP